MEEYENEGIEETPETGQGEDAEAAPDYAGFSTPEELAAAYRRVSEDKENLERLKGRMGNDLGQARIEAARLNGMVEALRSAKEESAKQGLSTTNIYKQLEEGEITESEALRRMESALEEKYRAELNKMGSEFKTFKEMYEFEKYKQDFLSRPENKGYVEAYNSGELNKWLDRGIPGETAWIYLKAEKAEARARELESKIAAAKTEAEKAGLQRGAQLERGKNQAGKVLGEGPGGRIAQKPGYQSKIDRTAAGVQYLERLRSKTI